MSKRYFFKSSRLAGLALSVFCGLSASAQTLQERQAIMGSYDRNSSEALQRSMQDKYARQYQEAVLYAQQNNIPLSKPMDRGRTAELQRILPDGTPIYYIASNSGCAKTTRANALNTGGALGLTVNGQNMTAAVWDGGALRTSHTAFGGRASQGDGLTFTSMNGNNEHANHVAGTVAASLTANSGYARGMAYAANVVGYDWNNDVAEATTAAANGLLLSNHSYGYGVTDNNGNLAIPRHWVGKYDETAADWDALMAQYPYYQQVNAAGNDRQYQANITNKGGYDLLTGHSCAKNAIVVAAVLEVANYTSPSSVTMSSFSNWGPTDDGRIKPDISAKGVDVNSISPSSNSAYTTMSGTSMASPSVTGTLLLLQQHYKNVKNSFMYASMLRGLMIHTADEAGTANGPDYRFGWGLMNAQKAAQVISNSGAGGTALLNSVVLNNGGSYTITVTAPGSQNLEATICWTDPAGAPITNTTIDDATRALRNDLDIRITHNGTTYMPWILNPASPANAATTGDNIRDNVEKIFIGSAPSGTYTITVTHKGTLVGGNQRFSLIVSGITTSGGGTPPPPAYCTSNGNASTSWIAGVSCTATSFSSSSTQAQSAAGYTDYTSTTRTLYTGNNTVTLTPGFSGSAATRYWAVYVDFNNDLDFADAGEQILNFTAGSSAATNQTLAIPVGSAGTTRRMRVVMSGTSSMSPCGAFSVGEVEDYLVSFVNPPAGYCAANGNSVQYEWIQRVQTGAFSNQTTQAQSTGGYTNHTNLTVGMTTGTNSMTLTPGFSGSAYTEYWAVYVDFNNDNDFVDAGEQILNFTTGSNAAVTVNVTIPTTAAGTTRRMRIVMSDNATLAPCGSFAYGEVEDYTVTFTTNSSAPTGYCTANGNNSASEWIDLVEFGGMSNASASNGGYGNFTSKTGTLARGTTSPFRFSAGFASTAYTEFWAIFIDFNRDGDFLDAGEQVVNSSSSSSGTLSANVTIPTSASVGLTRVRVVMRYRTAPSACGAFDYGEVEDYTLNITSSAFTAPVVMGGGFGNEEVEWLSNDPNAAVLPASADILLYPNPTSADLNVEFERFDQTKSYQIFTADGKLLTSGLVEERRAVLPTRDLPAGMYLVRFADEWNTWTLPFVKRD